MEKSEDGSIKDSSGKIVFVSIERFINEVCLGDACFLCSKRSDANEINKEHIIPDWILRKFQLHNKRVTLPNVSTLKYQSYVIPCCITCNELLGLELETPLSEVFHGGFESVAKFAKNDGKLRLMTWLSLLFIKTHIKDQSLLMNLDKRKPMGSIAKEVGYNWESFHHIYCISCLPFTRANVHANSLGSLIIIPILEPHEREAFDFVDLSLALTIGVRIGDVGLIAVFGDCGAVLTKLQDLIIHKIDGPLNLPQFRELVVHFGCCNMHLKNTPKFATLSDWTGPEIIAIACVKRDETPEFEEYQPQVFGEIMEMFLGEMMEGKVKIENFRHRLKRGEVSFLFDDNGKFIKNAVVY